MSRIIDMSGDFQPERSAWLFKSPLVVGGAYCGGRLQAAQLVTCRLDYYNSLLLGVT